MSRGPNRTPETAASLRQAFDRSFAEAVRPAPPATVDLLAIRLGTDPFALRLSETAGLFVDRRIVPVPGPVPELLGIAGLRGRMAPVYDLGALLGYAPTASPRWLLLARGPVPVLFGLETFETHVRVPEAAVAGSETAPAAREHVRGAVRLGETIRPLLHLASVLEAIARRARDHVPAKER